jgi:hypothetical protein
MKIDDHIQERLDEIWMKANCSWPIIVIDKSYIRAGKDMEPVCRSTPFMRAYAMGKWERKPRHLDLRQKWIRQTFFRNLIKFFTNRSI